MEFYVFVVSDTTLGLVHPVAIEGCFVVALFVIPSILEYIVELETRCFVLFFRVPLIVKWMVQTQGPGMVRQLRSPNYRRILGEIRPTNKNIAKNRLFSPITPPFPRLYSKYKHL